MIEDLFPIDKPVNDEILMWVDGKPEPQGSMSAFTPKNGKRPIITSSNKGLKPWRAKMLRYFEEYLSVFTRKPVIPAGPVEMTIIFKLPRTKTGGRFWADVKPDLDKLIRAVGDSLSDSKAFEDDSDVCVLHAVKRYAKVHETPGVLLSIRPIKEVEEPELFRDLEEKGRYLQRFSELDVGNP